MLELRNMQLQQGDFSLTANFTIPKGRIVAVLGPSGAGKSTLLAAIAGFLPIQGGDILWDGADLGTRAPAKRPMSILFQDNNLFPHMNARDNVALGLNPSLRLSKAEWLRVENALKRVGLAGLGKRKPATLSGGQNARVALARALLRARPIMLLDEPFGALGPGLKAEMLDLVAELAAETGAIVLFVTHSPEDAQTLAEDVVWVEEGVAFAPRKVDDIFTNPPPGLATYLGT